MTTKRVITFGESNAPASYQEELFPGAWVFGYDGNQSSWFEIHPDCILTHIIGLHSGKGVSVEDAIASFNENLPEMVRATIAHVRQGRHA